MRVSVCMCRPIQPDVLNKYHFVAISIMTFVGGYFGAVLGNAMMAETYNTYGVNPSYYKVNAAQCHAVLCCRKPAVTVHSCALLLTYAVACQVGLC